MSTDFESLRAEAAKIAPWLIPVIATCSANGQTSYLIDTARWTDPSKLLHSIDSVNGAYILLPDASAANRVRLANGNSGVPLDLTNGRIYPGVAWGSAPQSGDQYELATMHPSTMFSHLETTMQRFLQPTHGPASSGNDEDMEASGTSNYSVSGGGALSKATAAANVLIGIQSLFFNAGTAAEYCEGPSYRVQVGQRYFMPSTYRVDAGGPCAYAVWNKTADEEIESSGRISHSLEAFMVAPRYFTVPSGCEEIAPRWYVTAASDDVYIDHFHPPRKPSDGFIDLPSWLTSVPRLRKLLVARYDLAIAGDAGTVYEARSRHFRRELLRGREYSPRLNPGHATPYRAELTDGVSMPDGEIWIEGLRPASEVTAFVETAAGETSPTTDLPKRLLAIDWVVRMCEAVLAGDPSDAEALKTLGQFTRLVRRAKDDEERVPTGEYKRLLQDYEQGLETSHIIPQSPLVSMTRV